MHVQPTATNCAIAWCYFNFHQRAVNAGTDTCNGDTEQSDGRRLPVEVTPLQAAVPPDVLQVLNAFLCMLSLNPTCVWV